MVSTVTPEAGQAQAVYRQSIGVSAPLSGDALGERFGRSRTWAEAQMRVVHAEVGRPVRRSGTWVGHAAEARQVYRESVSAGEPLAVAELAARFGKTLAWATKQIDAVRSGTRYCRATVQQRSPARADRPRPAPEQPQRRSPESSATLADLYARHHEWLVRVISGRLNYTDRSWAEDLAQEVWLKVWPTLDRLDDLDSPRGFLTSVARHVVTDHYSPSRPAVVARRMEHLVEHWEFLDRPSALPSSSLPSSSLPSPSLPSPSLAPPRAAQVAIALGGLPGVTRRAVELHVGLGWSLRETADEMGLRLAAVHYRATTGMRALQESLSGAETGVQAGAA